MRSRCAVALGLFVGLSIASPMPSPFQPTEHHPFASPNAAFGQDAANPGANNAENVKALVSTALDHELRQEPDQRQKALVKALRLEPDFSPARWQIGQIQTAGAWRSIEQSQRLAAGDRLLQEYIELQRRRAGTLVGEVELAKWCRRKDLKEDERWHWLNVLQLQPNHTGAQRRLGLYWRRGQLMTRAQINADRQRVLQLREDADRLKKTWSERVKNLSSSLTSGVPAQRDSALRQLRAVEEVGAFRFLENEIAPLEPALAIEVVQVVAKWDPKEGTPILVRLALSSPYSESRESAINELKKRSKYAYIPFLLNELRMPLESDYGIYMTADGSLHYRHDLYEVGMTHDMSRTLHQSLVRDPLSDLASFTTDRTGLLLGGDRRSPESIAREKAAIAARGSKVASERAHTVEEAVQKYNRMVAARNEQIQNVLEQTTGVRHDAADDWWTWWANHNEYAPQEKYVDAEIQRRSFKTGRKPRVNWAGSCFARGTVVWTQTGLRAIEQVHVGDKVYSQDPETGELTLKRVVGKTLRPPTDVIRLKVGRDDILTTRGHPFWASGRGWRMVKFLETDMLLRTTKGSLPIRGIEFAGEWSAHNLIVADFHTYFVGQEGLLVHDNVLREPTRAILPGLIKAE